MATYKDFLAAGLTYRELGWWTERGLLVADNPRCGNGYTMTWPDAEVAVAAIMHRLRKATGMDLDVAHRIARAGGRLEVAAGVWVSVEDGGDGRGGVTDRSHTRPTIPHLTPVGPTGDR